MARLEAEALVKRYGSVTAVAGIDIVVPEGTLATFLGPSGCGKTTTLRMVAGLETPSSGRISIGDRTVFDNGRGAVPPERREIGMVFQSYAIWPHMTVAGNVAYPLRARRLPQAEIDRRVAEVLALVRLDAYADRHPGQLSGGQQQRVALARAIVFRPRMLLLDEPLSNLDAKLRETMRVAIRELQQRLGITALFVTHDQDEALALSDLVCVMDRGRIVQSGAPREVYERPASRFVADFVGWRNLLPVTPDGPGAVRLAGARVAVDRTGAESGRWLGVRPEDVRLDPPGSGGSSALPGRVEGVFYRGDHTAVEVAVGGFTLGVRAPAASPLARGDQVDVLLPAERLVLLED